MERIQAAIQKAKEQRDTAPGAPAPAPRTERTRPLGRDARPGERPAAPIWDALARFEPDPARMRDRRIVTFERTDPTHASLDVLRTKTLRLMREKGWKALGVTSPTTGCGKTTLVANLAFSLAHQPDMRTLVLDMDLRRPALGALLGIAGEQSVANLLRGAGGVGDSFVRYGDNLALATSAAGIRHPSEILQQAATPAVLADVRMQFRPDLVIYDLPPMLVSDDVIAFLPHLDCMILVAAAEKSRIDEIDKCEQDLAEHTNVLGVVLNKCRYPGEDYGYY
jgi:protein-tyrosine kinase